MPESKIVLNNVHILWGILFIIDSGNVYTLQILIMASAARSAKVYI